MFLVAARQNEGEERRALEAGVHGYLVDDGPNRTAPTSPAPAAEDSQTRVSTAVAIHQSQRRNQSPPRTRGSPVEASPLGGLFRCSADVSSREPFAIIGLPAVMAATGLVACG
jgi:hypothetical protein